MLGGLALAALLLAAAASAGGAAAELPDPVKVRLVAADAALSPGGTTMLAVHFDIAAGWHIYWRNPGDSGLPTEIAWDLPPGFTAGAIEWPVPQRFVVGTIGNYGYAASADLLSRITASRDLRAGTTARIGATVRWLVCSSICIPGSATLKLDLPVESGAAAPDASAAGYFAAAHRTGTSPAPVAADYSVASKALLLHLPEAALAAAQRPVAAAFFPFHQDIVDAASDETLRPEGGGLVLALPRATGPTAQLPASLAGLLVVRGSDGAVRSYAILAKPSAAPADAGEGAPRIGWWQALLLAFLGGAILNLMPCVFPVLALKLLGFTLSAHRAEERRHALVYALGVVASFAALGGVLLLLRAGGAGLGWGFQLQRPVVCALLAYVLFALGLSLSGVADFGVGFGGSGGRFADRTGMAGAFATGVLAAVVAAPCTGPLMGAALGFALVAPVPLALVTVITVGAGLAAPVVLAAAIPGIARLLPRPGGWMLWFKQLLAFPLYGTVAWVLWVLTQEVPPADMLLPFVGLVAVGFAVWIYGRTRAGVPFARRLGSGFAAAAAAGALVIATMLTPVSGMAPMGRAAADGLRYQRFAPARLDALLIAHKPVFVNLTAAWCITCLVNERATLDSAVVRRAFADRGIVALRGDWTRQDPQITAFLQKFGRSGVPLYLFYGPSGKPTVLPQLLTASEVLAALDGS
jgi:thiol:disulfide interchange protein